MAEAVRWQLELASEVVARIVDTGEYDFPWTYGRLVDSPNFERFRPYFTEIDDRPDDDPMIEALCKEVRTGGRFLLRDLLTGTTYPNIAFNTQGSTVWFRIG